MGKLKRHTGEQIIFKLGIRDRQDHAQWLSRRRGESAMMEETRFVSNYLHHKQYRYSVLWAVLVFVLCVLASMFYWSPYNSLGPLLVAKRDLIFTQHQYWRLFTTTFIHADLMHLLSNSFMFFIGSYFLCSHFGPLVFPLSAIIFGGVINAHTLYYSEPHVHLVGISGVIYFSWSFWLVMYFCIQQQMSVYKRLLNVFAVGFIILIPTSYNPATSYLAHAFGIFYGILFAIPYYWMYRKKFARYLKTKTVPVCDFEADTQDYR